MKKIVLSITLILIVSLISAQDSLMIKKPSIAIKFSVLDFKKTNHTEGLNKTVPSIGLQYLQGISNHIDFISNIDFANIKYPYYTSLKIPAAKVNKLYTAFDVNLNYKLLTDASKVVPYLTVGIGVSSDNFSIYHAYAPIGGGVQIKASHGSFIQLMTTYRAEVSGLTKMNFNYGLSYSVPLKGKEKKAISLPTVTVRADEDHDGVIDSEDLCPNQIGTVKYHGCPVPDTDNDGVNDDNDNCPNVAGTIKYNGCPIPDTDHDGINDEQDKCPTVSGLSRYNGCPIPDTDHDGINDEEDKCPLIAGIAANGGCADMQPILDQAAADLKFEIGKVYLSKKVLAGLDAVIVMMIAHSNVAIDICGHTDNIGAEKINIKLSNRRAVVVYNYLVKKGIETKRLTKIGFAATKPIADNATKSGRAKNRRVDMLAKY